MRLYNINPALPASSKSIDLAGKSVMITGATAGIGFDFARQALLRNASILYLPVRNLQKGEEVHNRLLEDPAIKGRRPAPNIKLYELDLSTYNSVLPFSKKFSDEVQKLDIAILNAGGGTWDFTLSPSEPKNEINLQVNFLSNALLSLELIPILKGSSPSDSPTHLTFVGSVMADMISWEKPPFKSPQSDIVTTLNNPEAYPALRRYGVTKLFLHMWARELAMKVSSNEIIVNYVCPGWVNSTIDRGLPWYLRTILGGIRSLTGRTTEEGAMAYLIAATAPKDSHGAFFSNGVITEYALPFSSFRCQG
jgi:NAD(P)-dependent dehydrogenase (short-subunit alcohol dehydrogenase family)